MKVGYVCSVWVPGLTKKTPSVASAGWPRQQGGIWSHVEQGLGWLHTLSPFVNVTLLGSGHWKVGFLASGWLLCLSVTGFSAPAPAQGRTLASQTVKPLVFMLHLPQCLSTLSPRPVAPSAVSLSRPEHPGVLASQCVGIFDTLPSSPVF
jgi:hypothetical protein